MHSTVTNIKMKLFVLLSGLLALSSTGSAYKVICYFTNWSRYSDEPFKVENIDAKSCSHIVYAFMVLDQNGGVVSGDPWNDFGDEWSEGSVQKFIRLKQQNPSIKLILGVGGWNEGPTRFQAMVRSPEKRQRFLNSSLALIRQYKFDGLEIDWIYHDHYGGTPADRDGLTALVQEMKPKYEGERLILGISTSAHPRVFDTSYNIQALSKSVDYINVMTYDLRGSWDKKTGHVAPLHPREIDNEDEKLLTVENVIKRYLTFGADKKKLVLGLVSYGRSFTLADPNNFQIGAPAGVGSPDPYPYRTFCIREQQGTWKKFRNEEQKIPYAVSGKTWVGYEDAQSLTDKVKFMKNSTLAGVSLWTLDFDDFKGKCGFGVFPLLKTVNTAIVS